MDGPPTKLRRPTYCNNTGVFAHRDMRRAAFGDELKSAKPLASSYTVPTPPASEPRSPYMLLMDEPPPRVVHTRTCAGTTADRHTHKRAGAPADERAPQTSVLFEEMLPRSKRPGLSGTLYSDAGGMDPLEGDWTSEEFLSAAFVPTRAAPSPPQSRAGQDTRASIPPPDDVVRRPVSPPQVDHAPRQAPIMCPERRRLRIFSLPSDTTPSSAGSSSADSLYSRDAYRVEERRWP